MSEESRTVLTSSTGAEIAVADKPPIVELREVSKEFRLKSTTAFGRQPRLIAVRDANIILEPAQAIGIVGESGSGKSTLGRITGALMEPTSGTALIDGNDWSAASRDELVAARRKVQLIYQDPTTALNPRRTIAQSVGEPIHVLGIRGSELDDRVDELLTMVGLDPRRRNERPRRFSGGQRQRVVIARALATGPKAVVADEAVSALDVSVQAQVLNLFRDLQQQHSLASIFISHDLAVINYVADIVVVMYLGEIVEVGNVVDVLSEPAHPYTVTLRNAASGGAKKKSQARAATLGTTELQSVGCVFRDRCPLAIAACATERPELKDIGGGRTVACHVVGATTP